MAHAFKVLERALPLLDPGGAVERREIVVDTAFGGPGARDAFELVDAGGHGEIATASTPRSPGPELGTARERFVFRLAYRSRTVTLTVRDGFVGDEFIALARRDGRSAAEEARLDVLKREMAERVMAAAARATSTTRPRLSLRVVPERRAAAVDRDDRAGDEARVVGEQMGDDGGDLVGPADAAERMEALSSARIAAPAAS